MNRDVVMKKVKLKSKTREMFAACLLVAPSLFGTAFLYVLPCVLSLIGSVQNDGHFSGTENYTALFQNGAFRTAFKNTVIYNITAIPLLMIISFLLAEYIRTLKHTGAFVRGILLVPVIVPSASVVNVWKVFFVDYGVINSLLAKASLPTVQFFNSAFSLVMIVVIYIWKYCGITTLLFSLGLSTISSSIIENARLDGATCFQIMRKITLPLIVPTAFFVLLMEIICSFQIFRDIHLLFGRYPNERVYFLQNYISNSYYNMNFSRLSAASVIISAITTAVLILAYLFERSHNFTE